MPTDHTLSSSGKRRPGQRRELIVLGSLRRRGAQTMDELTKATGYSRRSVEEAVRALRDKGHVRYVGPYKTGAAHRPPLLWAARSREEVWEDGGYEFTTLRERRLSDVA